MGDTQKDIKEENSLPIDWKPQDKCYFCVDGKLLTVNEAGELVAESGPVQTTEADLTNNRVRFFFVCVLLWCQKFKLYSLAESRF